VTLDPSKGPPVTVTAEVAATASARARGLMFRDHLPAGEGMFFPYPYADRHHFYMKNTRIPLDIIFFNAPAGEAVVVGVLEDMRPFDETPRSVDAPSTAALEVNARFARSHHIEPGTRVLIEPVSPPSK